LENLALGFEYRHRKADYPDAIFGLKKVIKRKERFEKGCMEGESIQC
jgi:hypothetical protein